MEEEKFIRNICCCLTHYAISPDEYRAEMGDADLSANNGDMYGARSISYQAGACKYVDGEDNVFCTRKRRARCVKRRKENGRENGRS
jgi:hypothetical protein